MKIKLCWPVTVPFRPIPPTGVFVYKQSGWICILNVTGDDNFITAISLTWLKKRLDDFIL